jgi:amino-acid N-acetyltransferase
MPSNVTIRPIEPSAAAALLAAADLPIDDLADPTVQLLGAFDPELVGVIGLQVCGDVGLLRSLAVDPAHRARGIARLLCSALFERCRELHLHDLYLLTTSAADYFPRLGFAAIDRAQAPDSIRHTAQFTSLCPSTAVVMRRTSAP